MKKFIGISLAVVFGLINVADAATARPNARGGANSGAAAKSAPTTTSARAARTAPVARAAKPAASSGGAVAVRSAVQRGGASTASSGSKTVAARAGAMQKVVGTGTKVASATKNVVVSEACQQKYDGCMDSFCMIENETGGRCLCSDKNAEFDTILAEIEKLDQQSYAMATSGVERIEMGDDADAAIANANAVAESLKSPRAEESQERKPLDLSLWDDAGLLEEEDDLFADVVSGPADPLAGKEGDALHATASQLCAAQIPECASELSLLQMMYGQRVKSDCAAYENTLKQQKTASAKKLQAAEKALRDAALTQYREANKYDLGQCTVRFKECMVSTGGCGDDFSQCASVVAMENTNVSVRSTSKTYKIQGASTTIEISPQTYDTLVAKKPLCESVTKQCRAVANQVWDTFLREVAPQLKSAELIAEDNARQNCIGSISDCFQKACKEAMDPNDPDGSYDMCLSRPENMLNVCKIPLNACGISTDSIAAAEKHYVWQYVVARLASMRVNACTTEVRECLTSADVCGPDYTQCVGLDTDTIIRMCPYDKLTGCQYQYGESERNIAADDDIYDEIYNMIQGIVLGIDNSMLTTCQRAVDTAMIKVCGDTENCDSLTIDEGIGTHSLGYEICYTEEGKTGPTCYSDIQMIPEDKLGRNVCDENNKCTSAVQNFSMQLKGAIQWNKITISSLESSTNRGGDTTYLYTGDILKTDGLTDDMDPEDKQKVEADIIALQQNINNAVRAIESDPTVQYCLTGREVQGMSRQQTTDGSLSGKGRFPALTEQMRGQIASSALKSVKDNYSKKLDEVTEVMAKKYVELGAKIAEMRGENELDARRDNARLSCLRTADNSIVGVDGTETDNPGQYVSSASTDVGNYKETITATFTDTTLVCRVCTRSKDCNKAKRDSHESSGYRCKEWAEVVESCKDIQF